MYLHQTRRDRTISLSLFFVAAMLWFTISSVTAFFWTVLIVWWVLRLDSQILLYVALALLSLMAIVSALDMSSPAILLANYIYYLLIIAALLRFFEFMRRDV